MKNSFSICIKKIFSQSVISRQGGLGVKLGDNLMLEISNSGSSEIIDCEKFFYFRFGSLLSNMASSDLLMANSLFERSDTLVSRNEGYATIIFFNKYNNLLSLYSDRVGLHNVLYSLDKGGIKISNSMSELSDEPFPLSNTSWLNEMVNFRLNSGSYTHSELVKKVPAGKCFVFDMGFNLISERRYWKPDRREPDQHLSINEAASKTLDLLDSHFVKMNVKSKKIAVLLSGGVDSSLLTALAYKHNKELVAITPIFSIGENPELDAAREVAAIVGLEHRVIEVTDEDVSNEFSCVVNLISQPIRSPHALVFSIIMRRIEGEFESLIFGEGADMMFGYHGVKLAGKRFEKQAKLNILAPIIPTVKLFKCIPKVSAVVNKLDALLAESVSRQVTNSWPIELNHKFRKRFPNYNEIDDKLDLVKELNLNNYTCSSLTKFDFENLVRDYLILAGNVDHFYTMGAIADRDGVEIISPFFDVNVTEFASKLNDNLYFGERFTKPVLRKLCERFYPERLIYSQKKGFPVPYVDWLNGPLKKEADAARLFIGRNFESDTMDDYEFIWLIMAFQQMGIEDSLVNFLI